MSRFNDVLLQMVFAIGIILVIMIIYITRLSGIYANDQLNDPSEEGAYAGFQNVYQYEQEEKRVRAKMQILKAEYANDLTLFTTELAKINNSGEMSELEKREKTQVLTGIYSDQYFARKLSLIDQEKAVLEKLLQAKCQRFCLYQDLPGSI